MLVILLVIACIALGFIGYDKFASNKNGVDVSYKDVSVHEAKEYSIKEMFSFWMCARKVSSIQVIQKVQ